MGATATMAIASVAGAAASALLAPKPPKPAEPTPMPDPLAQQDAIKKSLLEQTSRRGRVASILTQPAADGTKLGG